MLLSTILIASGYEREKKYPTIFGRIFLLRRAGDRARSDANNGGKRVGKARRVRQTRVEWLFAKLLGRKREIECNPCAANRKCRTNIFVLLSFPIGPAYSPVFLSLSPLISPSTAASDLPRISSPPLLSLSSPFFRPAHRKSLPRRQLSAGGAADWLRRKRVISVIRKAARQRAFPN